MITPFHLAIPVRDKNEAKAFYCDILGCTQGRESDRWIDLNLFGHQLVCHQVDDLPAQEAKTNPVDGHHVPVPHFGVVLQLDRFQALAERLKAKNITFIIEPYTRFKGLPGEQATMFFYDPSGNALEFKAFKDIEAELFKQE